MNTYQDWYRAFDPKLYSRIDRLGGMPAIPVKRDHLLFGGFGSDFRIFDCQNPHSLVRRGYLDMDGEVRAVYDLGHTVLVSVDTGQNGLFVVDVSDVDTPQVIAKIDYESIDLPAVAVLDRWLYICDRPNGYRILDVTSPGSPRFVQEVTFAHGQTVGRVKRIVVSAGVAYFGGTKLVSVNVQDPVRPTEMATLTLDDGAAWINDLAVYDNRAYLATLAAGLIIVDTADPRQLKVAGRYIVDDPLWQTVSVEVHGNTCFLVAGLELEPRALETIDVSDESNPILRSREANVDWIEQIGRGQMAFARREGSLDLREVGMDGEWRRISVVTEPGWITSIKVHEKRIFVCGGWSGLHWLHMDTDHKFVHDGYFLPRNAVRDVLVYGDKLLIQEHVCDDECWAAMRGLDFRDPDAPVEVWYWEDEGGLNIAAQLSGDRLYMLWRAFRDDNEYFVRVFRLSKADAPIEIERKPFEASILVFANETQDIIFRHPKAMPIASNAIRFLPLGEGVLIGSETRGLYYCRETNEA